MPFHGQIEQVVPSTTFNGGNQNKSFLALVSFFQSTQAASLGISMTTAAGPSTGSFWGAPSAGPYSNVWQQATINFMSASIPFTVQIFSYIQTTPFSGIGPTTGGDIGLPGNLGTPGTAPAGVFPFGNGTSNRGGPTSGANLWGNIDGAAAPGGIGILVTQVYSGSALYYPRANNPGGNYAAGPATTWFPMLFGNENTAHRIHVIANCDSVIFLIDLNNNGDYRMYFFGRYDPHSGSQIQPQVPYFGAWVVNVGAMNNNGGMMAMPAFRMFGDQAGTGSYQTNAPFQPFLGFDGGLPHPTASNGVYNFMLDSPVNMTLAYPHPNQLLGTSSYDQFPMGLCFSEINYPSLYGNVGQHNHFMRWICTLATHDTNQDLTRAVFGTAVHGTFGFAPQGAYTKITVPWDGATTPGSGNTLSGILF